MDSAKPLVTVLPGRGNQRRSVRRERASCRARLKLAQIFSGVLRSGKSELAERGAKRTRADTSKTLNVHAVIARCTRASRPRCTCFPWFRYFHWGRWRHPISCTFWPHWQHFVGPWSRGSPVVVRSRPRRGLRGPSSPVGGDSTKLPSHLTLISVPRPVPGDRSAQRMIGTRKAGRGSPRSGSCTHRGRSAPCASFGLAPGSTSLPGKNRSPITGRASRADP